MCNILYTYSFFIFSITACISSPVRDHTASYTTSYSMESWHTTGEWISRWYYLSTRWLGTGHGNHRLAPAGQCSYEASLNSIVSVLFSLDFRGLLIERRTFWMWIFLKDLRNSYESNLPLQCRLKYLNPLVTGSSENFKKSTMYFVTVYKDNFTSGSSAISWRIWIM